MAKPSNQKSDPPAKKQGSSSREKVLVVVESPKKIHTIQSCAPTDKQYIILPSVGHIADLAKKGKYNLGIDLDHDFKPSFVLNDNRMDVLRAIIDGAKQADKILIATDPDREGEHIGHSIAERIKAAGKPIRRVEFKELTKKGIREGLSNEKDINANLVEAAIARRVLDRVVGFLASPLIIRRVGKGLSAGRVQSVALRIVVDREREIEAFNPEEYWGIHAHLNKFASDIPIVAKLITDNPVRNEQDATAIQKELEKASYSVSKIEFDETRKAPPQPLKTSRLQKLASGRYGFAAARTMKAAQSLYEDGRITYIRTDSLRQSDDAIAEIRGWIAANNPECLPKKPNVYKNKNAATQDAHEAIRPTQINELPKNIDNDDEKLYRIIWETTVASQMTPALYDSTTVHITTNTKRTLKASGRIMKNPGWLKVTQYADIEKEQDNNDTKLPSMVEGDVLTLLNPPGVTKKQDFTKPPSRYSEATLIEDLEKKGIGRPSTYAEIMNKISQREYVSKKGNSLVATETGKKVVDFLMKYFKFMEINYTSELETQLDKIEDGEITYVEMMGKFYPEFKETIDKAYQDSYSDDFKFNCNKCGKPMVIKKSAFGYFLGCSEFPTCKNIVPCEIIDGKVVPTANAPDKAPTDVNCPQCGAPMVVREGQYGKFYSCSQYPNCRGWRKMPYGKKCPSCGGELYRTVFNNPPNKGPVLCCMSYPSCRYIEKLSEEGFEEEQKKQRKVFRDMSKAVEGWKKDIPDEG